MYSPTGYSQILNEYEFALIRAKINESSLEGYYFIHQDIKVMIDSDGRYDGADDLFALMDNILMRIS